jgi:uncharacterized protein (TIGR02246 family)
MALTTDDVVAIHQLYSAYCLACDDGDGPAFAACYTPDGFVEMGGPPTSGAAKLAEFAESVVKRFPGIRHAVTNVYTDGDGDDAWGRAYLRTYSAADGDTFKGMTGRYRDVLRRIDGTWRFAERHFTRDA